MTMISNHPKELAEEILSSLPWDLAEEILCRTPWTSTRAVRATCKKWDTLFKDESFTKKHHAQAAAAVAREGEFLAMVVSNFSLYLMRVNLHGGTHNPYVKPRGKLISLIDSDQVEIVRVCHCEGLLLCTTADHTRLVVWNPYLGQTRRICVEPSLFWYAHALGYEKSKHYKILRSAHPVRDRSVHEIYDLNSKLWRVLDITPDWLIMFDSHGLSLKGNTYWFAQDHELQDIVPHFLLCFDFTTERFGPRLPLPFRSYYDDAVLLSSLREQQLAVLFQRWDTCQTEIWVTTKIEPNAVSWSKFLAWLFYTGGSFLIDEERRAVVVFDIDTCKRQPTRQIAHIIGENGYYNRDVDLGEFTINAKGFPLACSYVPSSVQINQPA